MRRQHSLLRQQLARGLLALVCLQAGPALARDDSESGDEQARLSTAQKLLDEMDTQDSAAAASTLQRLQQLGRLPGSIDQKQRRIYYATLAQRASLVDGQQSVEQSALDALQAMQRDEDCQPCATELLLLQLHKASVEGATVRIRELLRQQAALPAAALAADQALVLAQARTRVLHQLGDSDAALKAGLQAAKLAGANGNAADQFASLELLSHISVQRRDFERALHYLAEALPLARQLGDRATVSLLLNQGHVYAALKDRPRQLAALQEALRLAQGRPPIPEAELICQNNLAHYYNGDADGHARAYRHALRAEQLAQQLRDPIILAYARTNRGRAMVHLGQVEAGLALANSGVAAVRTQQLPVETADLLEQLSLAQEAVGRHGEALASLRERLQLLDRTARSEDEQAQLQAQAQFDAESKALQIEALALQTQRNEAALAAQAMQQRLWAVAALALLLTAFLVARGIAQVRRRNRRLESQNASLDEQSSRDALTGAFNRRYLAQRLAPEAAPPASAALVLLDIDHFKKINDGHGHAAGDIVLKTVASRLQACLRGGDALVRWGGEEFLLLLPGCDAAGLQAFVGRALAALGDEAIALGAGVLLPVTASAGALVWPAYPGQAWEEALHWADQAMYLSSNPAATAAIALLALSAEVAADAEQRARLADDLGAAAAAGSLTLVTVAGPARSDEHGQATESH